MKSIRKSPIIAVMVSLLLIMSMAPIQAATENVVDRVPLVRVDFEFTDDFTPTLYIEEALVGEFRGEPQTIRLQLENAEWINREAIATDATFGEYAQSVTNLNFLSDQILSITLVPVEGAAGTGWWRIPLYSRITGGPYASVTIDPLGAPVTRETLQFAEVVDDRPGEVEVSLILPGDEPITAEAGDLIEAEQEVFIEFRESQANVIPSTEQVFRIDLENAEWLPNARTGLNAAAMEAGINIQGDTQVEITNVQRMSATRLEVTLRSLGFSAEPAVITMPLYLEVTGEGDVIANVTLRGVTEPSAALLIAVGVEEPAPPVDPVDPEPEITEVTFTVGLAAYTVNGQLIEADVAPYIQPTADGLGRIMVPVRFVSDGVGAEDVIWDPVNRQVFVMKGDITIEMTIGSNTLIVNGESRTMDAVAEIQSIGGGLGRTMVPLAHLARALDVEYVWDPDTQSVTFFVE